MGKPVPISGKRFDDLPMKVLIILNFKNKFTVIYSHNLLETMTVLRC